MLTFYASAFVGCFDKFRWKGQYFSYSHQNVDHRLRRCTLENHSLWRCRSAIRHIKCQSVALNGLFKNSAINRQSNFPSIRDKGVSHHINNTNTYSPFFLPFQIFLSVTVCVTVSDGLVQENLLCLLIHWIDNILVYSFY